MQDALALLLRPDAVQVQLQYLVLVVQDQALLVEHVEMVPSVNGTHLIVHRLRRMKPCETAREAGPFVVVRPGLGPETPCPAKTSSSMTRPSMANGESD